MIGALKTFISVGMQFLAPNENQKLVMIGSWKGAHCGDCSQWFPRETIGYKENHCFYCIKCELKYRVKPFVRGLFGAGAELVELALLGGRKT